ncbi:3-hydroxyacyl-CoA dehydrogenase family protein [Chloroflexota bacterium]
MEIKTVGVVGCGLMGSGIVEVSARAGYNVVVREVNQDFLDKGMSALKASMEKATKRGKMTEQERDETLARLKGTTDFADFKDCDLVIEAAIENLEEKKKIFAASDAVMPAHGIIASNTSCLSILDMAMATKRPSQVCGMHFFNPVPVMKPLEVIRTLVSSDETIQKAIAFGKKVGKQVITCDDTPGFIVNRIGVPLLLHAVRMYEQGLATKEDIDQGVMGGLNHPMGPITLCDFLGLDTLYFIACSMFDEFKEPIYSPPPLLKKMVTAGHLGRKSGKGFYDY